MRGRVEQRHGRPGGANGVKRLLLAIHDISFPSDPDEDIGRGAPTTNAAARLFAYARALGFTGVQLGPQGQTSRDNPSPYDGTIFSRHLATIAVSSFRAGGQYAGLVDERTLDGLIVSGPVQHRHAHDASTGPRRRRNPVLWIRQPLKLAVFCSCDPAGNFDELLNIFLFSLQSLK